MSRRVASWSRDSAITMAAVTHSATPMGTLMRKAHRQPHSAVSTKHEQTLVWQVNCWLVQFAPQVAS